MVILEIKKHFQLRVIEWWSASVMATWGFLVLLVPAMFQEQEVFSGMLQFAPQHIWGLAAFISGLLRLVALTINGFWARTPLVRWFTAMIGISIWFSITTGLFYAPVLSTGLVVYAWHMVADMYSAYRSASDFHEAELQRKLKEQGESGNVSSIHSQ